MAKRGKHGYFIALEGGEGSGKSTQIERLAAWLERGGCRPLVTREPGGTALGKRIRKLLLDPGGNVAPLAELFLYEADRAQHITELVRPALREGRIVLSDRHADSTLVYQGIARGLAKTGLLNRIATEGLRPDVVLVLDVPVEIGLRRADRRGARDRMERERLAFHRKVRGGFLRLAETDPARYKVVDASRSPDEVTAAIRAVLLPRLRRRGLMRTIRDGKTP